MHLAASAILIAQAAASLAVVPYTRIRVLEDGLVTEVRAWRSPDGAMVQTLHDGTVRSTETIADLELPATPAEILLPPDDVNALECVRRISPGWPASRAYSWSRPPDAILSSDMLERSLEQWRGGDSWIWYFGDLLLIARIENDRVVEIHEVFEAGTAELRDDAAQARRDLARSLERIRSKK